MSAPKLAKFISINEMCESLGVTAKTARKRLLDTGVVETIYVGHRRLVVLDSLNDYLESDEARLPPTD